MIKKLSSKSELKSYENNFNLAKTEKLRWIMNSKGIDFFLMEDNELFKLLME